MGGKIKKKNSWMKIWQSISNVLKLHISFNLEIIQTKIYHMKILWNFRNIYRNQSKKNTEFDKNLTLRGVILLFIVEKYSTVNV